MSWAQSPQDAGSTPAGILPQPPLGIIIFDTLRAITPPVIVRGETKEKSMHIKAKRRNSEQSKDGRNESLFIFEFLNQDDIDGFVNCIHSLADNLPLEKYYIDIDNLNKLTAKTIERMTDRFSNEDVYKTTFLFDSEFALFTESLLFATVHNNNVKTGVLNALAFFNEIPERAPIVPEKET